MPIHINLSARILISDVRHVKVLRRTVLPLILAVLMPATLCAGQYFSCDDMDHFSTEKACADALRAKKTAEQQATQDGNSGFTKDQIEMWAEPSVDSSGKVVSKLPPLPALKVLVDPTPENAKAYLEWNQKRIESLQKSEALIKQYSQTEQPQGVTDLRQIKRVDFYFSPT